MQTGTIEATDRQSDPVPAPDLDVVREHLTILHTLAAPLADAGKLILCRFGEDPETGKKCSPTTRHFTIGDVDGMVAAIRKLGAERDRNLYIPLAVMRTDLPKGQKGTERDVVGVLGIVADFDDDDACRWAERCPLQPDYVLETSTARFQAFFLLSEPATVDEVKPVASALTALTGCDHGTGDMCHVWRVAGCRNWPNRKKVLAGRPHDPQPVRVALPWLGTRTKLADLQAVVAHLTEDLLQPSGKGNGAAEPKQEGVDPDFNVETFVASLPDGLRNLITGTEADRSKQLNQVILVLLERGLSRAQIETVIQAYPTGVGQKYVNRTDLWKDIERIERYWRSAADRATMSDIDRMNSQHALVLIGSGASVLYQTLSTEGESEDRFIGLDAFRTWYANRFVQVGEKKKTQAEWWLSHPDRRQYAGVVFAPRRECPGYFNLWRGFAVEPSEHGDWSLFREHLLKNVASGDPHNYRWVFGWFAQMVQRPEERIGTSLALRGDQGTGKTKIGEVFGSLIPRHYMLADTSEQIIGKFNAHMASLLLLHADEAFFAGDPKSVGRLKSLVTAHRNNIERKGQDIFQVNNLIRLFITSNETWVVPAAFEERRFAVLDIGKSRQKDHKFFQEMDDQIDKGGRARLLWDLLNFDLSTVNLHTVPDTQALQDQKEASLEPEAAWWLDVLYAGTILPEQEEWPREIACKLVHDAFSRHATRTGIRRRSTEVALGKSLKGLIPGLKRRYGTVLITDEAGYKKSQRSYVYHLPPLDDCRRNFQSKLGRDIVWDEDGGEGEP